MALNISRKLASKLVLLGQRGSHLMVNVWLVAAVCDGVGYKM
jgi:hypothetical protein